MLKRLPWLVLSLALAAGSGVFCGEPTPKEVVIFDFEKDGNNRFEGAEKLTFVPDHATQGATAGKIKLDQPLGIFFGFYGGTNMKGRWGEFDSFVVDVFVEGGAVKVGGYARDKDSPSWDTRYNYEFTLQPGKRNLSFPLAGLNRQNGNGTLKMPELDCFSMLYASADEKNPATIYLDNGRLVKGAGSVEIKTLFSFEGNDAGKIELEDYPDEFKGKSSMSPVEEHATDGKKALKLESHAPAGNVQFFNFEPDWSRYDTLAIDIFNPSDKPVGVGGWIRSGDLKASWDKRHNYDRVLRPGFNSLKLPAGGLCTPDGRPIDATKIVSFNLAIDNQTVFIDNVRLIKGVEEIPVEGLKKFAFGPANSAIMPGFTRVSKTTAYDAGKGFGWLPRGEFGRDFDIYEVLGRHRPADNLCRGGCMPAKASFVVDLPNGDYQVWMMQSPPGIGWSNSFKHRRVTAQGKVVFDQEYTPESFKTWEFQFQDSEDLPGDDLWERYISVFFKPVTFDAAVADGKLTLDFDSFGQYNWATMLSGLVIWPKAQSAEAAKWLANLEAQRKEQYLSMHVENVPAASAPYVASADEKARGYVRFIHSPDREIQVNSVPTPEEVKSGAIALSVCPGQYESACVGLYPLKDSGKVKVSVSDLSGPGGKSIPAAQIKTMVVRYKALNQTAVYTILPKYLDEVPADGVDLKHGITRSFWAIVHVPTDAAPGAYKGQLTLAFSGGATEKVDLSVNVWPIKLVEPDFPMGMFMMGTQNFYPEVGGSADDHWNQWKDILTDAREHGLTSVDPLVNIPLQKIVNGKAEVDFSAMDRFMELARAAGFHQEINGYSIGTGFNMRMHPGFDFNGEAKRWGVNSYGEIAKAYFDAVREHAKEKNWLPICFCTDDEFIVHPGSKFEDLIALHTALQDNAPGFHFTTFDSVFYKDRPKEAESYDKLLAAIDTWGAGIHTPREAEVTKKANRRLWLYNTGMNRFTFGTYMFFARHKYDVKGFFQWIYSGGGTYGHFYLASFVEAHYGVVYPSTRGLRPTPLWERIRAGCDDHRYLETAWKLIEKAGASGKGAAEAKALKEAIEKTFAKLSFGNEKSDAKAAADGEGKADNPLTPAGMNELRRTVAEGIVALQKAME
jgi:hypothetical protein